MRLAAVRSFPCWRERENNPLPALRRQRSLLRVFISPCEQVEREGGVCVASPRQTALGSRDRVVRG